MNETPEGEKKIIVDEDWKSQAQAEKEALEAKKTAAQQEGAAAPESADQPDAGPAEAERPAETESPHDPEIPIPASFGVLVSTMATQVMAALGQLPKELTGLDKPQPNLAKHHIDMLSVLEEKTKGNLTPEEARMLEDALHQLRMLYVSVKNAATGSGP